MIIILIIIFICRKIFRHEINIKVEINLYFTNIGTKYVKGE